MDHALQTLAERLDIRAKSLIVTVCGDSIAPLGGDFLLGAMIDLLDPMGFGERVVRTSMYRLTQEAMFTIRKEGRRSRYILTTDAARQFMAAEARIYASTPDRTAPDWMLVLSEGGIDPEDREALRRELAWQGFAALSPGLLAHPAPDRAQALASIDALGLDGRVAILSAAPEAGTHPEALHRIVAEAWPMAEIAALYDRFLTAFDPFCAAPTRYAGAPQAAFQLRTLLVHAYRRIVLKDPGLPEALAPTDWRGAEAHAAYEALYRALTNAAQTHVAERLAASETESAPRALAPFYARRFGGLAGIPDRSARNPLAAE
ncbi:MAG: PaaX family transcriptional regulator C-terminal domain-containing protein [Alphaproteobacteria bacterium]|nr:PaaX family transcriptional regulator C-terminal domain-containing protein [Alphaproteobacteria bacterium]